MAIGLTVVGIAVAILGLLMVRSGRDSSPRRRRRSGGLAADAGATGPVDAAGVEAADAVAAGRLEALQVLSEPLSGTGPWANIQSASAPRQFRLGMMLGFGVGLAVAGLAFVGFSGDGAFTSLLATWANVTAATAPGDTAGAGGSAATPSGGGQPTPGPGTGGTPATGGTEPVSGGVTPGAGTPASTPPATTPPTATPPAATPPAATPPTSATPPQAAGSTVSLVINPGDSAVAVAGRLEEAGVVASRQAFLQRVVERQADTRLHAGQFRLRRGMSADEVIDILAP